VAPKSAMSFHQLVPTRSIEPRAFVPAYAATIGDVVMSVPFVEIDDLVGVRVHAERITVGTFLAFS
jgi:hypothetical protein